jgi:hypothetical protein
MGGPQPRDQTKPNRTEPNHPAPPSQQVDASEHRDLGSRFDVSGFPTLKFFKKGAKDAEAYEAGREVADFVTFLNDKAGTAYTAQGGLKPSYGRLEALDKLVEKGACMRAGGRAGGRAGFRYFVSPLWVCLFVCF